MLKESYLLRRSIREPTRFTARPISGDQQNCNSLSKRCSEAPAELWSRFALLPTGSAGVSPPTTLPHTRSLQKLTETSIIPPLMNFRALILFLLASPSILCAQTNPPPLA